MMTEDIEIKNKDMAPIPSFEHELIELKEGEQLEEGSLGCFMTSRLEGGIFSEIFKRFESQDEKIEKLDNEITEMKRDLHKVLLSQLKNGIVQLVNGLLHSRVITLLGDIGIEAFRGKHYIDILNHVDKKTRNRIFKDKIFKRLKYISGWKFQQILKSRNSHTYPACLNCSNSFNFIFDIDIEDKVETIKDFFLLIHLDHPIKLFNLTYFQIKPRPCQLVCS